MRMKKIVDNIGKPIMRPRLFNLYLVEPSNNIVAQTTKLKLTAIKRPYTNIAIPIVPKPS